MASETLLQGSPDLADYLKASSGNEITDRKEPITAGEIFSVINDPIFLESVGQRINESKETFGYLSDVCTGITGAALARAMQIPCFVKDRSNQSLVVNNYSQYIFLQWVSEGIKQYELGQKLQAVVHRVGKRDLVLDMPSNDKIVLNTRLSSGDIKIQFHPIRESVPVFELA